MASRALALASKALERRVALVSQQASSRALGLDTGSSNCLD